MPDSGELVPNDEWEEVDTLLVQHAAPVDQFRVQVPKRGVANELGLKGGERVRVWVNPGQRAWMYELIPRRRVSRKKA